MKTKRSLKLSLNPEKILIKRFLQKDKNGTIIETPEQIFKRVAHAVEVIVHEIPTSHW